MPMVTELMVEMFTTEPVMGGTSLAEQREHVLTLLDEPLTSATDSAVSQKRVLQRRLHDQTLSDTERMNVVEQLRQIRRTEKEQTSGSEKGS